jgi:hypothetical protein
MSLRLATLEEVPLICKEFQKFEKKQKTDGKPPVFAFIRQDYLKRCVSDGSLYFDNGIIAVMKQYKVRTKYGNKKGEWGLLELLNTNLTDNFAILKFMYKVLHDKVKDSKLYATIRDDNTQSIKFHTAFGYKRTKDIVWSNGTLPGGIYVYDNLKRKNNGK